MTIAAVSPAAQQLNQDTSAVATGNGTATFTFPSPPTSSWWSGSLFCAAAPVGAIFTAAIGATPWGEWAGNSVYGPVQCTDNQQLTVTATGLVPGSSYILSWRGSSDDSRTVQPLFPSANSTALTAQINVTPPALLFGPLVNPSATQTVTVPTSVRTLLVDIQVTTSATVSLVTVQGVTTNFLYYNAPPYLQGQVLLTRSGYLVVVPLLGSIDSQVTVSITSSSIANCTLNVYGDAAQYDESIFYNGNSNGGPVVIAHNAVGSGTLVSGPVRILSAFCGTATASASAALNWGGNLWLVAEQGTTAGGSTTAFTPVVPLILPAGTSITYTIVTGGNVSVMTAYP